MKHVMLLVIVVLLLCAAVTGADMEQTADPLVGLWVFERTDNEDMDFTSYVEYRPDGTYIFQMVMDSEVTSVDAAGYTEVDGCIVYDDGYSVNFSIAGDILTCTEDYGVPWEEPVVLTYHRVLERPPELLTIQRSGDYCYTEDSPGNATIVQFLDSPDPDDPTEILTVPDSLDGKRVTALREYAFKECVKDTIILPDGITAIPDWAFDGASVRRIVLPEGIAEIGRFAFADNDALAEINLPEGLVRIGREAFMNAGFTEIDLPDSLMILEGNPFAGCQSLSRIGVSEENRAFCLIDGVLFGREDQRLIWYPLTRTASHYDVPDGTRLIDAAFSVQQYLESVSLPDSITSIGEDAFYGCKQLRSLEIPASVTAIGPYAFAECWSLQEITIPEGVTELPDRMLSGAVELRTVRLPATLTRIGEGAFHGCDSLTGIVVPNGVTEIGYMAFYRCYSMTSVVLPESLESIGIRAFDGCSRLSRLVIPASVTMIGNQAFDGCSGLTLVVVPGTYAEQYCQEQGIPYEYAE